MNVAKIVSVANTGQNNLKITAKSQKITEVSKAVKLLSNAVVFNFTFLCQVVVKEPLPPQATKSGDSFEDTMLLLDIVREKKKKQNENKKVRKQLFSGKS